MITLNYFSDLLCVWAYTAQPRLAELQSHFGDQVEIRCHYINLFGDTQSRIGEGWQTRGGFEGFAEHTREVVEQFPEFSLHPDVWKKTRPRTSMLPHLYLKAVEQSAGPQQSSRLAARLRRAFFSQGLDISQRSLIRQFMSELGIDLAQMQAVLDDGRAHAALWQDQMLREQYGLEGSPSYVLNQGRQKLFGNVGYRILEANVKELLEAPVGGASWC